MVDDDKMRDEMINTAAYGTGEDIMRFGVRAMIESAANIDLDDLRSKLAPIVEELEDEQVASALARMDTLRNVLVVMGETLQAESDRRSAGDKLH